MKPPPFHRLAEERKSLTPEKGYYETSFTDPYPALFIRVAAMLCWVSFSW